MKFQPLSRVALGAFLTLLVIKNMCRESFPSKDVQEMNFGVSHSRIKIYDMGQ
jgi:hypothetical protein